jgi:hypothetical protein
LAWKCGWRIPKHMYAFLIFVAMCTMQPPFPFPPPTAANVTQPPRIGLIKEIERPHCIVQQNFLSKQLQSPSVCLRVITAAAMSGGMIVIWPFLVTYCRVGAETFHLHIQAHPSIHRPLTPTPISVLLQDDDVFKQWLLDGRRQTLRI